MVPFLVVHDVVKLSSGGLALVGTDEYIDANTSLALDGKAIVISLRGGRRLESSVLAVSVQTALSGRRNISFRVSDVGEPEALKGAIVSVASELSAAS